MATITTANEFIEKYNAFSRNRIILNYDVQKNPITEVVAFTDYKGLVSEEERFTVFSYLRAVEGFGILRNIVGFESSRYVCEASLFSEVADFKDSITGMVKEGQDPWKIRLEIIKGQFLISEMLLAIQNQIISDQDSTEDNTEPEEVVKSKSEPKAKPKPKASIDKSHLYRVFVLEDIENTWPYDRSSDGTYPHLEINRIQKNLQELKLFLEKNPDDVDCLIAVARVEYLLGNKGKAEGVLFRVLEIPNISDEHFVKISNIYLMLGKRKKAVDLLKKHANKSAEVALSLSYLYRRTGEVDKTIEVFQKHKGDSSHMAMSLARYLYKLKRYDELQDFFEKAFKTTPNPHDMSVLLFYQFVVYIEKSEDEK